MKERNSNSPVGRGIEILKDTLDLFTPSRTLKKANSSKTEFFSRNGDAFEGWELKDVCSLEENSLSDLVATETSKPFAGYGSLRYKHGFSSTIHPTGRDSFSRRSTLSSEAPAKLGTGLCKGRSENFCYSTLQSKHAASSTNTVPDRSGTPVDIKKERHCIWNSRVQKNLQKQRSFCSDIDREEAWERKRDIFLMDEFGNCPEEVKPRTVVRSVSDCCDRTWPMPCAKTRSRTKTRSLTDEDLEELRGCIDLGFGFSDDESSDLRNTLPALDLYYAINRQYNDMKSRSSPVSPLDGMLGSSSRGGSPGSPLTQTWIISSPGDNPNQVKTRLRHWAQAVACSIRQGSF
eukprot:c21353_g1_i1 orf=791-1831(-)